MATPTIEITLPPVPSAQIFTDKTGILTQPAQQWLVNLRDKVNAINAVVIAISGAGTPIGAFNELSPLTTNGDLLTYSGGTNIRLPIGTAGQVLTVVSGMPAWAPSSGGGGGSSTLTINNQTGAYTLVLADGTSTMVVVNSSSKSPITIPVNSSVAFPVGTVIYGMQAGSGPVRWKGASGVTLLYSSILIPGKNNTGRVVKIATDTWVLDLTIPPYLIYQSLVIADSPLAYWTFDSTLASAVGSFTWTYNSGTALTYSTPLIAQGNSANFGTAGAYYSIPYNSSFNTSTYCIELWISFTTSANDVIFECNGNTGFSIQTFSGGLKISINGATIIQTASAINDGLTHYIVFNMSSGSSQIYVDGNLNVTNTTAYTPNLASQPIYLGSRAGSSGFVGVIDELCFYVSKLTSVQIANHYNIGAE